MTPTTNASRVPAAGECAELRIAKKRQRYCLPRVVVIGAMRAGTSALAHALSRHPGLARNPDGREVHYFSDPFDDEGALLRRWPAYAMKFPARDDGAVYFEKTAQYLTGSLRALARLLPRATLAVVLREPGARAYSEFQHHCRSGRVVEVRSSHAFGNRTLKRGAVVRGDRLKGGRVVAAAATCYSSRGRRRSTDRLYETRDDDANPPWRVRFFRTLAFPCAASSFRAFAFDAEPPSGAWSELEAGNYAMLLRRAAGGGAPPRLVVVDADELREAPAASAKRVAAAAGLDAAAMPSAIPPYAPSRRDVYPALSSSTRRRLDAYYRKPNDELRRLLGVELRGWS